MVRALFIPLLVFTLSSCAANSSSQSKRDRAMSLLNNRDYAEAIKILEELHQEAPENEQNTKLLIHAYLGSAGVEILTLSENVLKEQIEAPGAQSFLNINCTKDALERFQQQDFRCLLFRFAQHFPHPDHPHLVKAKKLLRSNFSDISKTNVDINFLATLVEIGSLVGRASLLLSPKAYGFGQEGNNLQNVFNNLIYHLKRSLEELGFGIARARFSYTKVTKYVTGLEGKPVIKIGNQTMLFDETFHLHGFLKFGGQILQEYSKSIDLEGSRYVDARMRELPEWFWKLLKSIDPTRYQDPYSSTLLVYFHFQRFFDRIINAFFSWQTDSNWIDTYSWFWENPPIILKNFGSAFLKTWEQEKVNPLLEYYAATATQWIELDQLMQDWSEWFKVSFTEQEADLFIKDINQKIKRSEKKYRLPEHVNQKWLTQMQKELLQFFMKDFLETVQSHNPISVVWASYLVERSTNWVNKNLYPTTE